jgi:3-oxoacyl-[acyl-carrier protein] reductase
MITEFLDFSGRVAIVTGGGTGIGYATALQLARLGASVVIASRTENELSAAAQSIRDASGAHCIAVPTDVKDEAAITRLMARAEKEFGRIDILINNAGGTRMGPLENISAKAWDSAFDLNMRAAFLCTQEAGKRIIAQKSGAIVNVSSGAGITGVKGGAHYSAAKSALQMFTTVTAAEWGKYNVRVNCVAPGLIASPRASEAWRVAGLDADALTENIPLKRIGVPDDLANMIVFLASDAASYISGQTISVDGGPKLPGASD